MSDNITTPWNMYPFSHQLPQSTRPAARPGARAYSITYPISRPLLPRPAISPSRRAAMCSSTRDFKSRPNKKKAHGPPLPPLPTTPRSRTNRKCRADAAPSSSCDFYLPFPAAGRYLPRSGTLLPANGPHTNRKMYLYVRTSFAPCPSKSEGSPHRAQNTSSVRASS